MSTYSWKPSGQYENPKRLMLSRFAPNDTGRLSTDDINKWFMRSYEEQYHVDGFDEAKKIIDEHPDLRIHVFGDFDVDGRTATVILKNGLKAYGRPDVCARIPKRNSEGYGMNMNMVNEIENQAIIITCDNGIAAIEPIAEAKKRGHIVIVTDHHQAAVNQDGKTVYPEADVIIDPNALPGTADFAGYCGAGLAYKFIRFLIGKQNAKIYEPLAAVATIADGVPLREENFVFARDGLRMIGKRRAPLGLLALFDAMGVEDPTAENVSFKIAPPINAPGRLHDEDMLTIPMLETQSYRYALNLAKQVRELNNQRKDLTAKGMNACQEYIDRNRLNDDPCLILKAQVISGMVGILAGKVTEKYKRPCVVFTEPDNEIMKGSGRSVDYIDLKALLDQVNSLFVKYGGHAAAAGITMKECNLEKFREEMNRMVRPLLTDGADSNTRTYDYEIEASQIAEILDLQEKFEPHGEGNPKPVYKINNFMPTGAGRIGENGIKVFSPLGNAVAFGIGDDLLNRKLVNTVMTLYGTLAYNVYRKERTLQIVFVDYDIVHNGGTEFAEKIRRVSTKTR